MEDNLLRGVESPLEYRVIHPDGSIHAVYAFGKIFTDRSGKPVRNRGYVQDITERKQAEDELRASEQRFSTIISSSPIGIYISSLPEGTFLNTNPALLDLLGYERDEVIGNTPEKLGLWADSETSAAMYDLNKHRRSAHSLEAMLKTKSGKAVSVLISTELIQVDGQRVMLGMLQDITSRKEAENALRASETRLATIFKNSPIGISVTDIESGMMFEASPAMLVMLGYSREEALGHTTVELGIWPDLSERERFKAELKQGGKARNFQTTLRNKSGNLINVRIEAEMVEIDGKSVMLSVMEDITSRKSMEKALLESEKLVGIGTLAAGIAHEINTPLQVVCGISETLLRKIKNSEAMAQEDHLRRLEMVNNNAWRIAAIVRALMEYARISTGQVKLCTINEIVASALKLIEHQFKGGTNIRINLNLEDGMPEVSCDAGKIIQVLINLLNNARDAMPAGGKITISTSCNQETGEIYLRVEDSGTGVPDEIRGRIFDPFFTTCEPGHGMGLGLPVAAGIMRAHHGRLDLERSSEHGSVFLAVLPLSAGDVEEVNITSAGRYKNTPEG
jgi:PAS domain S-box-containing protein